VPNKTILGVSVSAAVVIASFTASALRAAPMNEVRRLQSQPRNRLKASAKLGTMPSLDDVMQTQQAALAEKARVAPLLPQPGRFTRLGAPAPQIAGGPGLAWVNVGPTDAFYEFNYSGIYGVDSGRPTAIVVDPRDPNVVYDAVSGGGIWKTYDFVSGYPTPTWIPVGDTLPVLAIGALALDPNAADTLYAGTGDSFDIGGNQVFKSTDGGATWGTPVTLAGTAPGTTTAFNPAAIRDIRVDPENGMNVMVASDQGLFRSTNGGTTFTYVDLPNATANVMEATWSLAYLGNHGWLISGVTACNTANKARGPRAGFGSYTDAAACPLGNLGDLWRSTDSGATWTSLRNTKNALPLPAALPTGTDDLGRMMLAAGPTTNPAKTAIYVFAGDANDSITAGILRSTDGGQTFVDATGVLANPTLAQLYQGQSYSGLRRHRGRSGSELVQPIDPRRSDERRSRPHRR
jgi:hypothetical protein